MTIKKCYIDLNQEKKRFDGTKKSKGFGLKLTKRPFGQSTFLSIFVAL